MDALQDVEGVTGLSSTGSADRSSEPTPRSAHGHTHYIEEIARLKGQLAEATEALQGAPSSTRHDAVPSSVREEMAGLK